MNRDGGMRRTARSGVLGPRGAYPHGPSLGPFLFHVFFIEIVFLFIYFSIFFIFYLLDSVYSLHGTLPIAGGILVPNKRTIIIFT